MTSRLRSVMVRNDPISCGCLVTKNRPNPLMSVPIASLSIAIESPPLVLSRTRALRASGTKSDLCADTPMLWNF